MQTARLSATGTQSTPLPQAKPARVAIEGISPQLDGGRFAVKRIVGDVVAVEADAFADGHDRVRCVLQSRPPGQGPWREAPMAELGNDRFRGEFHVPVVGRHEFRVVAWAAHAGEAAEGAEDATVSATFPVWADPERARASAWYELFPRSCSPTPGRHGTLRDVQARLPYVASLGFDVLYLPPIHPIGRSHRKGPNNSLVAGPGDVGSPWAIGGPEGGHKAVHPELGTLRDFDELVAAAKAHGIDIAMDLAYQCSPDHPYIREHPEWFRWRADGTVACAENPPKKYEDVVPFDFEGEAWASLWEELASVVDFWVAHGVRIFRVDNPHTKPFAFWEWLIARTRAANPDVLFLSEAFTRPKPMRLLAKVGFTHSYTYFAWRDSKWDLEQYLTELQAPEWADAMRPHFWPNTPDILTATLQQGGRAASAMRLVLAATLSANYGVYGPAFELADVRPRTPGKEEYLDSEKYQLRHWDLERPGGLRPTLAAVNRARRLVPALTVDSSLRFHRTDNPQILAYSKRTHDHSSVALVIVNLDWANPQGCWTDLDVAELGVDGHPFQAEDLLDGSRYTWNGPRNFVRLDPHVQPAHIFRIHGARRREAVGTAGAGTGNAAQSGHGGAPTAASPETPASKGVAGS